MRIAYAKAQRLWLLSEKLGKGRLIERLLESFRGHLEAQGYIASGGEMVDETIVWVKEKGNSGEENEAVKGGKKRKEWEKNGAKKGEKDKDERWKRKHGKSF